LSSFNSLPVEDIYKKSQMVDIWTKVFKKRDDDDFNLTYPSGYGPSNGFYIFLNQFETNTMKRLSNRFILSVSKLEQLF